MTTGEPEIRVDELREAKRRLLDAAERRLGSTVELRADVYWGLFAPDMFSPEEGQPEVLGRSLTDDIAELRGLLARPEDPFEDDLVLWHDLNHLVGILQRISSLTS
jgi:hypothetical protein